jgi:anti-sigma regulatory factor (Ser/Thr protein kinase)
MPQAKEFTMGTADATYPGSPEHISAVRADLRALLDGWPIADDVLLCLSELATNAVLHSDSRLPGRSFAVRGKAGPGGHCLIEVEDEGGPWAPAVANPGRGHGLDIVQALADDGGIDGDYSGRTVWARFDWPKP